MSGFDLGRFLNESRELVEEYADSALPATTEIPGVLYESMRYSFFAGGKRIRPALAFGAALAVCGDERPAVPFATAIELIHTYSLIHDDLPSMDDDALRRGLPTNHVKFGEAVAILAGDALLTDAFTLMTDPRVVASLGAEKVIKCVSIVANAAGSRGMVGGQALDMLSQGTSLGLEVLEYLHSRKTGALIRASVHVGAVSAGASAGETEDLLNYAERVGLAFQIADDILDVEGETALLGKPVGSDEGLNKATFPALLGMAESKARLKRLIEESEGYVSRFGGRGEVLRAIAHFIAARDH